MNRRQKSSPTQKTKSFKNRITEQRKRWGREEMRGKIDNPKYFEILKQQYSDKVSFVNVNNN